jgi:hypothetical protein
MHDSLQNTEKEKAKLVFTIIYVDCEQSYH